MVIMHEGIWFTWIVIQLHPVRSYACDADTSAATATKTPKDNLKHTLFGAQRSAPILPVVYYTCQLHQYVSYLTFIMMICAPRTCFTGHHSHSNRARWCDTDSPSQLQWYPPAYDNIMPGGVAGEQNSPSLIIYRPSGRFLSSNYFSIPFIHIPHRSNIYSNDRDRGGKKANDGVGRWWDG